MTTFKTFPHKHVHICAHIAYSYVCITPAQPYSQLNYVFPYDCIYCCFAYVTEGPGEGVRARHQDITSLLRDIYTGRAKAGGQFIT